MKLFPSFLLIGTAQVLWLKSFPQCGRNTRIRRLRVRKFL